VLQTRKLKVQTVRYLRFDQTTTIGFLTLLMVAILAGPFLGVDRYLSDPNQHHQSGHERRASWLS